MFMNRKSLLTAAILISALLAFESSVLSEAEVAASYTVKVRAVRYQDYVRIVLTTDESLARSASVIFTKNKTIRAEFSNDGSEPARKKPVFSFATENGPIQGDKPVEIGKSVSLAAKDNVCIITVPNAEDIKVMKLQSPSRVVIDAFFTAAPKESAPAVPQAKQSADQIAFRSFMIDAGHGGYDYGIRGAHFVEKDFVLAFARELTAILSKNGREAVLLRKSDQVMSIQERVSLINKRIPDIVISLHLSSTKVPVIYTVPANPEGPVGGSEAPQVRSADQKKLETAKSVADAISRSFEKEFSVSAARETLPLSLLVRSKAPAVLIELPNPDEFSYEKKGRERLLSAILKGLAAAKEEKQSPAPPKPEGRTESKPDGSKNGSKAERI